MSVESSLELDTVKKQMIPYCSFSLGKKMLEERKPSYSKLIIQREHARIAEALAATVHYGPMPFGGIQDLRTILANAEKGMTLTPSELLNEVRIINGLKSIVSYEKELTEVEHPELKDLVGSIVVHDQLARQLSRCLNDYGELKDNASQKLESIRHSLKRADGALAEAAARFISNHASSVVDSIVTTRLGRTVVLMKAAEKNSFGGMVYGDSASGQASYVEPSAFVALNNRKQQLIEEEKEETERILRELSNAVGKVAKEETANIETCAILDELFAKAEWGRIHNACVAQLTEDKEIIIEKAAHPLIDEKKVVTNNYRLSDPHRVLLITGPNTGGKTVSMKVIGLFVLMTYCGMPVTSESATIPFFDRVFADIGDDQSVASSLSSFSAHIQKQAEITRYATADSLVLLDEVGSGTDPREGEALAIAILNDLRQKKCMTIATTHYGRLKAYGKRHDDILLASVQFDQEKLTPTYKYMEGLTGSSNAFEVAQKYGLPSSIIKYARFLKNQAKTEEDELIERLEAQLNANAQKGEELEQRLHEVEEREKQLKKDEAKISHEKEVAKDKAEREAEKYLDKVKKEADEILADMRKKEKEVHYHEALSRRKELSNINQKKENETPVDPNHVYQVGDAVELRANDQVCEIVKIEKKDITVLLNGREIRVRKNQIRPSLHVIPRMKKKPQETVVVNTGVNLFSTMSSECNLIGMHVDEAMEKMDAYIDQCKVHGLKNFRIIHGDGSGALRKAVHQRLTKDKSVKEFHLGMPNEGGTGATVVTLN